ncbi:hypothetical protein C8039_12325 [Halogeometricum sp. wsp3]|nr:hypothetical protein C8039_12325 [Halogeometricum sp. wsp3]
MRKTSPNTIAPVTVRGADTKRPETTHLRLVQSSDGRGGCRGTNRTAGTRAELLRIARDDPELLDDLDRVEQFIELGDENPEIVREAREFATTGQG